MQFGRIKLGQKVIDQSSGFTGIVSLASEHLNGNIQFVIQPRVEPEATTLPDAQWFDQNMVDVIDDGVSARVPAFPTTDIKLGFEVEDSVTGFRGVATEKHFHLNGCIRFRVVGKLGLIRGAEETNVDHARLREVRATKAAKIVENRDPKVPPTGGPGGRFLRRGTPGR